MWKIIYWILIIIAVSLRLETNVVAADEENLALNKPVWASPSWDYGDDDTILTDGDWAGKCLWVKNYGAYVIVDMELIVNVKRLVIREPSNTILSNYEVVVSDKSSKCDVGNVFNWTICKGDKKWDYYKGYQFSSTAGNCQGRFLGIRVKELGTSVWTQLCEIIINGDVIENLNPGPKALSKCVQMNKKDNIALNKPVVNTNGFYKDKLDDGKVEHKDIFHKCYIAYTGQKVTIDLGGDYLINSIRVWNGRDDKKQYGSSYLFNVSVATKNNKGDLEEQLLTSDIPILGNYVDLDIPGSVESGSVVISGHSNVTGDYMMICEVEIAGSVVPEITFPNGQVVPISEDDFPESRKLRKHLTTTTIPFYSTTIVYFDDNCEPFLSFPSQKQYFSVVCTYKTKGRAALFAKKYYYPKEITDKKVLSDLNEWLSPNAADQPLVQSQKNWKSLKQGEIVLFDNAYSVPEDERQSFLDAWAQGSFALVLQSTQWHEKQSNSPDRENYQFILESIKADFSPVIINYSPIEYSSKSSDVVNWVLPPSKLLTRMIKSKDEFVNSIDEFYNSVENQEVERDLTKYRSDVVKIISTYDKYIKKNCPSSQFPVKKGQAEEIVKAYNKLIKLQFLQGSQYKAACVKEFPGDISKDSKRLELIKLRIQATKTLELHSTGYYLAAGDTMNYKVKEIRGTWRIVIGCHKWDLSSIIQDNNRRLTRYPLIQSTSQRLLPSSGKFYSPFGGVIYLEAEGGEDNFIIIEISNVVEGVFINIREEGNKEQYLRSIKRPSDQLPPFAEIQGNHFSACVPTKSIIDKSYDDLKDLFYNYWDRAVDIDNNWKSISTLDKKMERFTLDLQLPFGYGISGYPMTGYLDWEPTLVDPSLIKAKGSWGVLHELGHNMDISQIRYDKYGDRVNNLFVLFNYKYIWGWDIYNPDTSRLTSQSDLDKVAEIMPDDDSLDYSRWDKDFFYGLRMMGQIAKHCGFGAYSELFREVLQPDFAPLKTEQDKKDAWYLGLSKATGMDLGPIFKFWDFPISNEALAQLQNLPCFLPDDIFTKLKPNRVKEILSKYQTSCLRKSIKTIDFKDRALPLRPNNVKYL